MPHSVFLNPYSVNPYSTEKISKINAQNVQKNTEKLKKNIDNLAREEDRFRLEKSKRLNKSGVLRKDL